MNLNSYIFILILYICMPYGCMWHRKSLAMAHIVWLWYGMECGPSVYVFKMKFDKYYLNSVAHFSFSQSHLSGYSLLSIYSIRFMQYELVYDRMFCSIFFSPFSKRHVSTATNATSWISWIENLLPK